MTKEETIRMLQSIESRATDFPYMTACDWIAIAAAKRHLANTLEVKEDAGHYELEEFAKIIRGNLTGISKDVQSLFEAKYQQLTGNKMYVGYKD